RDSCRSDCPELPVRDNRFLLTWGWTCAHYSVPKRLKWGSGRLPRSRGSRTEPVRVSRTPWTNRPPWVVLSTMHPIVKGIGQLEAAPRLGLVAGRHSKRRDRASHQRGPGRSARCIAGRRLHEGGQEDMPAASAVRLL